MIAQLKPGQNITCTITGKPRTDAGRLTIQRLMRRDPQNARALRKGQRQRAQNMRTKIRGGRTWYNRVITGKICHPDLGNSWNMTYTPDIEHDLRSVSEFLEIKPE